jgi:Methyltransferase domain
MYRYSLGIKMEKFIKNAVDLFSKVKFHITRKRAKPHAFINWLKWANAGMLTEGNLYCFEYAIEHLPSDNPIVEIGSFCGLSTNLISFYLRKNNRSNTLITSDKWIFPGGEESNAFLEGSKITNQQYKEFVKESYLKNIAFFSKDRLPYTIEEFSDDFFKLWEVKKIESDVLGRQIQLGGAISFAYIDGNHAYEYAKRDFENVDKYLELGGFIFFDDSADGIDWEVNRVLKEIKKSGRYEIIIKNPNYLIKKIR